jgi:serine/threonine-protein kinase HipA
MNPSVERNELTLAINEVEATCDVSIAMDASSDYGISKDEADGVIQEVKGAVGSWRAEATSLRIPRAEQEFMAAAFD